MDQQPGSYRIRLARPGEIPRLRAIEDEAVDEVRVPRLWDA